MANGHGGKREGAGRKNGSKARKTICVQTKLEEMGCDPIEGMARIAVEAMADGDRALAMSAYKELAQYIAPKRKAMELSNEEGSGPLQVKWKL